MGQGQTEVALEKLHLAAEKGEWLCLKNLHLVSMLLNFFPFTDAKAL
jgi:hypothetical protein